MLQEQQKILSTKVQYIVKIKQNNTDILVKTFHPNSGSPHDWYYSTASNWPKKAFSNCCLLCFLLLSQLVVNEISVYRVKGEWFSSTFVFVSILLCHRQGLEGCSIKISLNISACSLHYWCQFQYNLLFHMHICVSYLEFVNLGVGYTLRLIKSKLSMILQDLVFHTKLE